MELFKATTYYQKVTWLVYLVSLSVFILKYPELQIICIGLC